MKSRITYMHEETNEGKVAQLEALHQEFVSYVQECVTLMVNDRKYNVFPSERLEAKLSGMVKTGVGTVANDLVSKHPGHTFVIEDLDLSGCKGQKRFAYRQLHHALSNKAAVLEVNPAYTSQMCPSCGHVSRNNRRGTDFECRSCGRISHADFVGALNLLRRSEDKQVGLKTPPNAVKKLLQERFRLRRKSQTVSSAGTKSAPEPSGPKLTVGKYCTASNQVAKGARVEKSCSHSISDTV